MEKEIFLQEKTGLRTTDHTDFHGWEILNRGRKGRIRGSGFNRSKQRKQRGILFTAKQAKYEKALRIKPRKTGTRK